MKDNESNFKYEYIKKSIEFIRSRNQQQEIDFINSSKSSFLENNVICVGGLRQSGKTTAMKMLFDVNKDIYISPRTKLSSYFMDTVYSKYNNEKIFEWTKEQIEIIEQRNCILSMQNYNSLRGVFKSKIKNDSVIFLDVFSIEIPDNRKHVDEIIKLITPFVTNKNILVIT